MAVEVCQPIQDIVAISCREIAWEGVFAGFPGVVVAPVLLDGLVRDAVVFDDYLSGAGDGVEKSGECGSGLLAGS